MAWWVCVKEDKITGKKCNKKHSWISVAPPGPNRACRKCGNIEAGNYMELAKWNILPENQVAMAKSGPVTYLPIHMETILDNAKKGLPSKIEGGIPTIKTDGLLVTRLNDEIKIAGEIYQEIEERAKTGSRGEEAKLLFAMFVFLYDNAKTAAYIDQNNTERTKEQKRTLLDNGGEWYNMFQDGNARQIAPDYVFDYSSDILIYYLQLILKAVYGSWKDLDKWSKGRLIEEVFEHEKGYPVVSETIDDTIMKLKKKLSLKDIVESWLSSESKSDPFTGIEKEGGRKTLSLWLTEAFFPPSRYPAGSQEDLQMWALLLFQIDKDANLEHSKEQVMEFVKGNYNEFEASLLHCMSKILIIQFVNIYLPQACDAAGLS